MPSESVELKMDNDLSNMSNWQTWAITFTKWASKYLFKFWKEKPFGFLFK